MFKKGFVGQGSPRISSVSVQSGWGGGCPSVRPLHRLSGFRVATMAHGWLALPLTWTADMV